MGKRIGQKFNNIKCALSLKKKYLVGIMFKLIPTRYSNVILNIIK